MTGVVVIGAGQAGASLVAKLRDEGYQGAITLVGDEPVPPYQRPPLSKKYLLGEMSAERLYLRPERYYSDARIDLRLGTRVTGIDRAGRAVMLGDKRLQYEHLVLATGSVPRRLPSAIGGDLDGVHVVRTLSDVDRMSPGFDPGARLLIVGGGYIGLEAAAVAASRGMTVTLVEMADRILGRVAAPETAAYFRALHQRHGVDIREGVGLERLTGDGQGRVRGARLGDGTEMEVDMVVVGVGILPDTRLAESAGLEIDNGIAVDAQGRTSDPAIWAVGDCASFPHEGARLRLESVPNAIDMAECVAGNILGAETAYVPKPWFWSDQYDVKLQIAGLNTGYDRIVTRDTGNATSFWYYRGDRLLAVDAMNDPRAYMVGKRLIEAGKTADPAIVADPAADLKSLLTP
jgi:3-phenylpropionate/trans-cinnamate dioxygenase ferredoxin reductase subunit